MMRKLVIVLCDGEREIVKTEIISAIVTVFLDVASI